MPSGCSDGLPMGRIAAHQRGQPVHGWGVAHHHQHDDVAGRGDGDGLPAARLGLRERWAINVRVEPLVLPGCLACMNTSWRIAALLDRVDWLMWGQCEQT